MEENQSKLVPLPKLSKEEKRIEKRRKAVEKYPDDQLFYIQSYGYVGNSILMWGLNSSGYTTNPEKAQKYTKEEVLRKFVGGREEDKIWPVEEIESKILPHVDSQYLNYKKRI